MENRIVFAESTTCFLDSWMKTRTQIADERTRFVHGVLWIGSSGRIWRSYLPIYESLIHVASRENKQNSGVLGCYSNRLFHSHLLAL